MTGCCPDCRVLQVGFEGAGSRRCARLQYCSRSSGHEDLQVMEEIYPIQNGLLPVSVAPLHGNPLRGVAENG